MNLPTNFIANIRNAFQADGERWLADLPTLIDEAAGRWRLGEIQPVPNLSYNYVAFAQKETNRQDTKNAKKILKTSRPSNLRGENLDVVLKIGVPNRELTSEIAALTYFNGDGAVRILDSDAEKGMFLLERVAPGRMLATVMDDDLATRIAADVMLNLWNRSNDRSNDFSRYTATEVATTKFIRLIDWFDGLKNLRPHFNGETGPFPRHLLEKVETLLPELFAAPNVLLHGDFHHYNVLDSERGWLIIDPKGVIGPKGYEMGPLLINPFDRFLNGINPKARTERRIAILSEKTGLERSVIQNWGLCHAILSAWWDTQPDGTGGEYSLRCAEIIDAASV